MWLVFKLFYEDNFFSLFKKSKPQIFDEIKKQFHINKNLEKERILILEKLLQLKRYEM